MKRIGAGSGKAKAKGSDQQPIVGVPVDDMGRELTPARRPMVGPMFTPRILDRRSQIRPPVTADQIIQALAAAEHGDMGPQADLSEVMQDRDPAYLGFRQTRILAPSKLPWSIEPADDSPLAKEIAEFVSAEIRGITNFPHAHRDLFGAIGPGVAALWVDWQEGGRSHGGKAPKSQYRIDGIHHINPKRYRFHWLKETFLILPDQDFERAMTLGLMNPTLGPTGFSQFVNAGLGVEPPPWKVILHRSRVKSGHPAKGGVDRVCALPFFLRMTTLKDAGVYCEVYGMPFRVAKYPPGMQDEEKLLLAQQMEQLGTDAVAIVSNVVEIDWLEASSRAVGGLPFFELMKECERQIQLAWLGQDQTNTHNPTGGRTQVKEGGAPIRQDLVEADCIDAMTTYTMQLCKPIVGFSEYGWDLASTLCPLFKIQYKPEPDFVSMATSDEIVYTKLKLPVTNGMLAKRYNRELPKGVDPEALIDYTVAAPQPFGFGAAVDPQPAELPPPPVTKPPAKTAKPKLVAVAVSSNFAADAADDGEYSYASTQVMITGAVRGQVLELAAEIPDDALAEKGREETPHVTVKYGIDPAVTIEELRAVIGPRAAGSLTLGSTAFFAAPDYDVVFVTVDSPDLVALNKAIVEAVKTTATKPHYVPHLTLAYVESGRGHEFAGNGTLAGVKYDFTAVHYSDVDGNLTKIQAIRGHVRVTPPRPKGAGSFYEPRFWKEGDETPDGWPSDFYAAASRATFETLTRMAAQESDPERRAGLEADCELVRRDCWAMVAAQMGDTDMASGQAAIDDLQERASSRAGVMFRTLAKQAREIVMKANSLDEVPDLLRAAFSELDVEDLARLTQRTLFVARLRGRATAKRTPAAK